MDALAALRLQIEWGADEALDDAPVDRRRDPTRPVQPSVVPPTLVPRTAAPPPVTLSPDAQGRDLDTVESLRAALEAFDGRGLRNTATSLVLTDGNPGCGLVLIGEAPSDDDDREGRPFSGPGGQLLDQVFASIGLDRTQMMLTMLVPWRPPGKRSPSPSEIQACLPFLLRHLAIVRPRRLVLFGGAVTRALGLGTDNITRLRGRWTTVDVPGVGAIDVLPMRPVELSFRTALHKRELWADLLSLRASIDVPSQGDSGDLVK